MSMITTPLYCDNYNFIYPFIEYDDNDTVFLELKYYISREFYTPTERLSNIENQITINNQPLFDFVSWETLKDYKLLQETPVPIKETSDLIEVTQIYGFTPDKTYEVYSSEVVNRYGLEFNSGTIGQILNWKYDSTLDAKVNTYEPLDDRLKLYIPDGASDFKTGDIVKIKCISKNDNFSDGYSDDATVLYTAGDFVFISATSIHWVWENVGDSSGKYSIEDALNTPTSTQRQNYLVKVKDIVPSKNEVARCREVISFSINEPECKETRFYPTITDGTEQGSFTPYTVFTSHQYLEAKKQGKEYILNDSNASKDSAKYNLWKKTIKYVKF